MTKSYLLRFLCPILFSGAVWAQGVQNSDIYFLTGPAHVKPQVIAGSSTTLSGSTGVGVNIGYGYQAVRKSAASLWVEFLPTVFVVNDGSADNTATHNRKAPFRGLRKPPE